MPRARSILRYLVFIYSGDGRSQIEDDIQYEDVRLRAYPATLRTLLIWQFVSCNICCTHFLL